MKAEAITPSRSAAWMLASAFLPTPGRAVMKSIPTRLAGIVVLASLLAVPAWAGIERFYGEYQGEAVVGEVGEVAPRDLSVRIDPANGGFRVRWTAVIHRADGEQRRRDLDVIFRPSARAGIYRSAMRRDMFGHDVPLDPMRGEPYVWARLAGDALTVHAMLITEEGGYEMQVYERRLIEDGLSLSYRRVRDGEVLRTVHGHLRRVR
jgi:hypothetical protein